MRRALGGAGPFDRQSSDRAPSAGGSYVLLVHLSRSLEFERPGLRHRFEPGWYGYVGSARGPGGIRARIGPHLCAEKAVHWHIDSLTITADIVLAFFVEGASECTLSHSLLRSRYGSRRRRVSGAAIAVTAPPICWNLIWPPSTAVIERSCEFEWTTGNRETKSERAGLI
ncbi:DUF123 domain-containing protein [Sphingomonas sp. TX0543]|nr:DUF123 domain-containing protein [Sphingomonas fennica]